MKNISKFWQICREDGAVGGWICLLTAIFLLVGAACTPPFFVIDASILAGAGEVFAFFTVLQLPRIIQSVKDGKSVTFKHGDTELTVEGDKKENEE